ncbi:N-acetylmuramoyl-L-alanine amidase family protein [Croceibacterium xixiisoli]|uniref:N-acetylmuramoyl-L-alanine amidase family protein n=1 Tax=Croceibacterium xixiisoli TaxID=1476466 RepID=UPI002E27375B
MAGLFVLGVNLPMLRLGENYVIRFTLPEAGEPAQLPVVQGPDDPARPLVVIDAGHGGRDPGASGDGFREKDIVLGLAQALRDDLLAQGGIRVALTRNDDRFLVVEERFEIARALDADLFLSIHADSAGEKAAVSGASIYTLSEKASSEAAARFAARENTADAVNGVVLSGRNQTVDAILVELSQRRTSEGSAEFARLIEREGQGALQFLPPAQRSAALRVLRAPDVPSVLFESGFITNPEDAERLASPAGRKRFAEALSRAIRIYFARNPSE